MLSFMICIIYNFEQIRYKVLNNEHVFFYIRRLVHNNWSISTILYQYRTNTCTIPHTLYMCTCTIYLILKVRTYGVVGRVHVHMPNVIVDVVWNNWYSSSCLGLYVMHSTWAKISPLQQLAAHMLRLQDGPLLLHWTSKETYHSFRMTFR